MRTLIGLFALSLPAVAQDPADVFPARDAPRHRPCEVSAPAPPAKASCPMCGPACQCGALCDCSRASWAANCAAVPAQVRATYQPPRAVVAVRTAPPVPDTVQQPRPVVAARPFRDTYSGSRFAGMECEYDPDHVCNRCGAVQLVIYKWNADGTHSHKCGRCGHTWRHRG